ncbi:MAG: dihydrofolate reductase family protein [SAR324 cluster bacterium]|nr:dihydrofolate reductase family protein [SAR324 cluster bacterium]
MQNRDSLKATLIMVMSANGMVSQDRDQNSFEWNSPEDREQLLERIQSIGTVLMGANTFRIIEDNLYEGVNFFVLTHHPSKFKSQKQVTFIQGDAIDVCQQLQKKAVNHIALLGGTETNSRFLDAEKVDEIFLTLEPLLLAGEFSLANRLSVTRQLHLLNVSRLRNQQTLLLHYRVEK